MDVFSSASLSINGINLPSSSSFLQVTTMSHKEVFLDSSSMIPSGTSKHRRLHAGAVVAPPVVAAAPVEAAPPVVVPSPAAGGAPPPVPPKFIPAPVNQRSMCSKTLRVGTYFLNAWFS